MQQTGHCVGSTCDADDYNALLAFSQKRCAPCECLQPLPHGMHSQLLHQTVGTLPVSMTRLEWMQIQQAAQQQRTRMPQASVPHPWCRHPSRFSLSQWQFSLFRALLQALHFLSCKLLSPWMVSPRLVRYTLLCGPHDLEYKKSSLATVYIPES